MQKKYSIEISFQFFFFIFQSHLSIYIFLLFSHLCQQQASMIKNKSNKWVEKVSKNIVSRLFRKNYKHTLIIDSIKSFFLIISKQNNKVHISNIIE